MAIFERTDLARADLDLILAERGHESILDVGCGPGVFVDLAHREGFRAIGLDYRLDSAAAVCAHAAHLPFAAASFDVVRAKDLVEHLLYPLQFVREARRVLKPGGLLILHVASVWSIFYPYQSFWWCYEHIRPFTRASAIWLVSDGGFTVRSIRGYTMPRRWIEWPIAALVGWLVPYAYLLVAKKESA